MTFILLLSCAQDKEIYTFNESIRPPPAPPSWELEDVEFFNCIQFEEFRWGQEHSCKVLVAFNSTPSPPPEPPSDGSSLPPPPEEGECQFIEEQPEEMEPGNPSPVNGVDAGPSILFENDQIQLELVRQDHGEYGIVYALPDCSEENFPFGEVMDLVVSGSSLQMGIPAFTVEDAIAFDVRPSLEIVPDESGNLTHQVDQPWPLSWILDADADALLSSTDVGSMFEVADGGYPKIDCTPTPAGVDVGADELQLLYAHTTSPEVMFHRSFHGPEKSLPWGNNIWTSTQYHIRGTLNLIAENFGSDTAQ